MQYYVITKDGVPVTITFESPYPVTDPTLSAHTFDGPFPDLNVCVWNPETETYELGDNQLTKLAFLSKFTLQERIAIRASTDPVVEDIMELFDAAQYISKKDPNTIQGLQYIGSVGLLTPERVAEILG